FPVSALRIDLTTPPTDFFGDRAWPVIDKQNAVTRLCERGILREDGTITAEGLQLHIDIERQTDAPATSPIAPGNAGADRLAELLEKPVELLRQRIPQLETIDDE